VPAAQEEACAVQPDVDVRGEPAVDGVEAADEKRPAGHIVQARSAVD
jgi:hypothetical protein